MSGIKRQPEVTPQMIRKGINYFLYGTGSKEEYELNRSSVNNSNHNSILAYSSFGLITAAVLVLMAFNIDTLKPNAVVYGGALIFLVILVMVNMIGAENYPMITLISTYLFIIMTYVVAIYLLIDNPYQVVTVFLAIIPITSVIFIISPLGLFVLIYIAVICSCTVMYLEYNEAMVSWNMINVVLDSIFSFLMGFSIIMNKQEKITSNRKLEELLEKDSITGIYNRRSYENALQHIKPGSDPYAVCVLDINSLKRINDTIGHSAGDELIIGAAHIVQKVFKEYGRCYRIGGDEFVAILTRRADIDELMVRLNEEIRTWHGKLADSMSMSYGFASKDDYPRSTISDLIKDADRRMYEFKEQYYARSENERRH